MQAFLASPSATKANKALSVTSLLASVMNRDLSDQEVVRARNELKGQVSDLVMKGVNSVLDKEVDAKTHQDMLNKLSQTL
jgi:hypothetical protein